MSLLLAVVLVVQSQSPISVDFAPMPVRKAMSVLSRATGKSLKASDDFIDEVLFAHLKDAPADQVLQHIAEVLAARWETRSDGALWLLPDAKVRQQIAARDAKKEEDKLARSIEYVRKHLEAQSEELDQGSILKYLAKKAMEEKKRKAAEAAKDYDHVFAEPDSAEESPAWRALARILLEIDPKHLLAMPNDAVEVWAENPTPMQHALPDSANGFLATYRREVALMDSTIIPSRVKVILNKWESGSAMSANIHVLDPNGKIVDKAFVRLNDDSELMKIPFGSRPKPKVIAGQPPIALPLAAREFRSLLSNDYKGKDKEELFKKYQPRLLEPEKFEPTELFRGKDLIVAGSQTGKNVVGTVCDLIDARYAKSRAESPSEIFVKSDIEMMPAPENWVIVRPSENLARASRRKAALLLKQSQRLGGISVDLAADWTCQSTGRWPFINWVGDFLDVMFTNHGPYSTLGTTLDDISLRLWGAIPPGYMDSLKRGGSVNLSSLPPEVKRQIHEMVYWHRALDLSDADPTDKLPNGIEGGSVTMEVKETPVFIAWNSQSKEAVQRMPYDAKMFGKGLAVGSSYWEIQPEVFQHFDRFRMGLNRKYELHFSINPGALPMTVTLSETFFPPESENLERLPESVRKEVGVAEREAAAQPKNSDGKGVIPPQ